MRHARVFQLFGAQRHSRIGFVRNQENETVDIMGGDQGRITRVGIGLGNDLIVENHDVVFLIVRCLGNGLERAGRVFAFKQIIGRRGDDAEDVGTAG